MNGTARATGYGYSLWEFQVFGEFGGPTPTPDDAAAPAARPTSPRASPATASSTENAGTPAARGGRRQRRHPLVQRRSPTRSGSRSTSARRSSVCQVDAALGGRVRARRSRSRRPTNGTTWTTRLRHHHRHRRHADPQRHRHRPLRADERHRPRPPATATRSGSSRSFGTAPAPATPRRPTRSPAAATSARTCTSSTRPRRARRSRPGSTRSSRQQESASSARGAHAVPLQARHLQRLQRPASASTPRSPASARTPTTCSINGDVTVDAGWFERQRHAELLALGGEPADHPVGRRPTAGPSRRPRPFRRMHVNGRPQPRPGRRTAGPAAATSPTAEVDGQVGPYSQQQWYTRDSTIGGWGNGVWNMVFSGVAGRSGADASRTRRTPRSPPPRSPARSRTCTSTAATTRCSCPSPRTNARGATLGGGTHAGHVDPAEPVLRRQARRHRGHASTRRWPRA